MEEIFLIPNSDEFIREYWCQKCRQLRLWAKPELLRACSQCNNTDLVVALPGELDADELRGNDRMSVELAMRWRKICYLLVALDSASIELRDMKRAAVEDWTNLAKIAGVRPPSPKTVALILRTLAEIENRVSSPSSDEPKKKT